MNCKDINKLLAAYLDDEVTSDEREQIEAHLSTCPRCREELEVLAATEAQLREALKAVAGQVTPSAQAWVGIKQRLAVEEQPRVTTWSLAKSKLKGGKDIMIRGLVSRQPVWKTAVVSVLAVALVISLAITIPPLTTQSAYAQAEEIAKNSQTVRDALGGGEVEVVKVINLVDDEGTLICQGTTGLVVTAKVDLEAKEVTEVVCTPELTEVEEEEAINIARADPRVRELLDMGASIGDVSTLFYFGSWVDIETGEREEFSQVLVIVTLELGEESWQVLVDLAEGKVVKLVETPPMGPYPEAEFEIEYLQLEEEYFFIIEEK